MHTLAVLFDKTWEDPIAFFTFVLAISTIGLWIVTAIGIRNQSRDTHILERAYLSVEPQGISPHHDRGDRVVARIIIRNVGHLPARNIICSSKGGAPEPDHTFPIEEPTGKGVVLPPGGVMMRRAAVVFTSAVGNALFVWGLVRYDDGFGKRRFTRFCHYYITKPFPRGELFDLPGESAELNEYGNDAD